MLVCDGLRSSLIVFVGAGQNCKWLALILLVLGRGMELGIILSISQSS